jgi:hypothetical protein
VVYSWQQVNVKVKGEGRMAFDDALALAIIGILMWVISSEIHPAIGCLALVGAFALGGVRRSLWTALLLCINATMVNLVLSHSQWMSLHIREGLMIWEGLAVAGLLLALFAIICGTGWLLGRFATRLVRREMPT